MTKPGVHVGAVVASITALVLVAAPVSASPDATSERRELRRDVEAVVAAGATGAVIEVDTGSRRLRATAGLAELDSPRPVPVHGRFRIGSVTKAFVATVVLQLVAEHRLGLDDTVESRLPGVLPDGDRITIRELLDHTSGVPDYLTTLPSPRSAEFLTMRWRTWTAPELVARVSSKPLLFTPGSQASYSNTNYLLLGMVIERVTGRPYRAAIRDRILRPLGLHHTSLPGTDPSIRGPHAHGYLPLERDGATRLVDITAVNPSIMGAGGEMVSTARDLNRFFDGLMSGRLLPRRLTREMTTTAKGSRYGLGIIERPLPCEATAWGKDGDVPGYSTWSFTAPDNDRHVTLSVPGAPVTRTRLWPRC